MISQVPRFGDTLNKSPGSRILILIEKAYRFGYVNTHNLFRMLQLHLTLSGFSFTESSPISHLILTFLCTIHIMSRPKNILKGISYQLA